MATFMSEKTDPKVYSILEDARVTGKRVRLWYGNTETGEVWQEEYDVLGSIGRSTGTKQVFLLINNVRSLGGPAILTDCIMRITIDKREVYRHPSLKFPSYAVKNTTPELQNSHDLYFTVEVDGEKHASFKTIKQAKNWIAFMKGERNSK